MLFPMTELDAVNELLGLIGEQPVNSIDNTGISESAIALSTLRTVMRDVQAGSPLFTRELEITLQPDIDGTIVLPTNTIGFSPVDPTRRVGFREDKLYDLDNHTFIFTEDLTVNLTLYVDFEDLHQTVKTYIVAKAARIFQKKILGSETLDAMAKEDEKQAYIAMNRELIRQQKGSVLKTDPGFSASIRRGNVYGRY